jgi:molybdopterin-guanine dinucleotide biosynthesis protein A
MKLRGVVLAGGRSSRFGSDKALQIWDGITLLERAARLLDDLELEPVVIANPDRDYSFLPYPVLNDRIPGQGPLEGLFTACVNHPGCDFLVLTCDMPQMASALLRKLIGAHAAGDEDSSIGGATLFEVDRRYQPFPGIYSSGLEAEITTILESKDRSMMHFLKKIPIKKITLTTEDAFSFNNVNYPGDLQRRPAGG